MKDPFVEKYKPSELKIAAEFLTAWLPFLTRDLCNGCSQSISTRISSLDPDCDQSEPINCDCDEKVSTSGDGDRGHVSWADMAQEEEEDGEEKRELTRDERERLRFMHVGRKKDFVFVERIRGSFVNILDGLELHTAVFSAKEQSRIVDFVYKLQEKGRRGEFRERTFSAPQKWMRGKGRETMQFGCCYNYAVLKDGQPPGILRNELVDPIPSLLKVMIRRLVGWHVIPPTCVPDSCIVNIYEEGDCIPPHIDHHDFVRPFCTVSFLSECNILFGSTLKILGPGDFSGAISVPLPVGSVLVLKGNGADVAKHCVPAVPTKRISITFRKMDETKLPFRFVPEPDLQGLQPLPYELDDADSINPNTLPQMNRQTDRREIDSDSIDPNTPPQINRRTDRREVDSDRGSRFSAGISQSEPHYPTQTSSRRGSKRMSRTSLGT